MAISARLSRTLHVTLGEEAADDMVNWMQRVDSGRSELRELNELTVSRLESRISETRHELRAEIAGLREEMRVGVIGLEAKVDRHFIDSLKWMFALWIPLKPVVLLK